MVRFNYIIAILGIVGEIAAIYPKNAVMQDIFFGIFCMGAGMVCLANSRKFSERLGICPDIPLDNGKAKKAAIAECMVLVAAALIEVLLYLFRLPYTYTSTVIAVIGAVLVSRIWRGKFNQQR